MLFAPKEIEYQQAEYEKKVNEARSFFEKMPENGVIVHGGIEKYARKKKIAGINFPSACYYFVPKADLTESGQKILSQYEAAMQGIKSNVGYAFGDTTQEFLDTINDIKNNHEPGHDVTPKELYTDHPELEPSILVYEAPPEFSKKYGRMFEMSHEVTARENPVPAKSFLFEVKLKFLDLVRPSTPNESQDLLLKKFKDEIDANGWKPRETQKSTIQKLTEILRIKPENKSAPSVEDVLLDLLEKKPRNPLYAEAVSIIKKEGINFGEYLSMCNYLVNDAKVITLKELVNSHNPMGIYELFYRFDQVKNQTNFEIKGKVHRILGVEKSTLLKRENAVIKSIILAIKLKQKYPKDFVWMVIYGSTVDRFKPNSDEIDIKIVINPPTDGDTKPSNVGINITNELIDMVRLSFNKDCAPTVIYTDDLNKAKIESDDQISKVNSGLDARCVPIIFGRKNRQLFRQVFAKNLKSIQTR